MFHAQNMRVRREQKPCPYVHYPFNIENLQSSSDERSEDESTDESTGTIKILDE